MAKPVAKKQNVKVSKSKASEDDSFIPAEAVSSGGGYYKPEDGDNRIRIITKPVFGWAAWTEDEDGKKCTRTTLDNPPDASEYDAKNKPKKFMACMVVDQDAIDAGADPEDAIKLWECTQQSIIKAVQGFAQNPKWGNPYGYDLNIVKTGQDKKTRYAVQAEPKSALDKAVIAAAQEKPVNLENLFEEDGDIYDIETGVTEYRFK